MEKIKRCAAMVRAEPSSLPELEEIVEIIMGGEEHAGHGLPSQKLTQL